ncbi:MAG: hypothetical protein HZB38_15415 [Planctomycetes bacterium]|nr:hypothetical protein [Planctomycetota bacterium]
MIEFDPEKHGPGLCAYLDGELDADAAREIERLLDESGAARGYLDELRAVSRGLSALPRIAAPDRILQSLQAEKPRVVFAGHVRRLKLRMLDIFPQTLALAALLAFVWVAGRQFLPPASSRVDSTAPTLVDSRHAPRAPTESIATNTTEDAGRAIDKSDSPTVARVTTEALSAASPTMPIAAPGYETASKGAAAPAGAAFAGGGRGGAAVDESAEKAEPVAVRGSEVRPVDPDAPPVVNVFIATRSGEEFEAMNALLADYGAKVPPADGVQERKSGPAQRQFHQMELPSGEMEGFLAALETDAPRQVNVEVRFSPKQTELVQQMVGAPAADDAQRNANREPARNADQAGQPAEDRKPEPMVLADVMPDRSRKEDDRLKPGISGAAPAREATKAGKRSGAPSPPASSLARRPGGKDSQPSKPAAEPPAESQADIVTASQPEEEAAMGGVAAEPPAATSAGANSRAASAPQNHYGRQFRNAADWLSRSQAQATRAAGKPTAQNVLLNVFVEPPRQEPLTTAPASQPNR